jgi:hypothetical protein
MSELLERNPKGSVKKIGDNYVVAIGEDIHLLNSTAYSIWDSFSLIHDTEEIIKLISQSFKHSPALVKIRYDIKECMDDMVLKGLLIRKKIS